MKGYTYRTLSSDIAEGSLVAKWPDWIRWVLFLPAAIFGAFLASTVFLMAITIFGGAKEGSLDGHWYRLVQSAMLGALFIYIGAYVAPRYQSAVAVGLLVLGTICMTVIMTLAAVLEVDGYGLSLVHAIVLIAGEAFSLYTVMEQSKGR